MTTGSAQSPPRFAPLLVWAFPISFGLLVAAVSVLEVLATDPRRSLVTNGDSRPSIGFAVLYQVVFVIGFTSIIGARLSQSLTAWTILLLPIGLALFTLFHCIEGFAEFLQLGTLLGFGLALTIVGLLLLPFVAALPGAVYALILIAASFFANVDSGHAAPPDLRRIFGYSAVAAVIYSWSLLPMRSVLASDASGEFSIEVFIVYSLGVVLSGYFLCKAAWYAAGWQQRPGSSRVAACCIVAVFAFSTGLIAKLRYSPLRLIPSEPAVLGYLRDNIRLRRVSIDEPVLIGNREFLLPELRKRGQTTVQVDRTTRELRFIRWKSLDDRLVATPSIEIRHFKGSGWDRVLSCAPPDDRGVALCRILGNSPADKQPNGTLLRSIWTSAQAVELQAGQDNAYLAVSEHAGRPTFCRILFQNFPAQNYVVEAALDCTNRQRWPELAEHLRSHLLDHLVAR